MNPHEMTLGSPNPRKLMLASVRIAHPTASEPYRKDNGSTLGAMCTNIVRTWLAPSTRAASTYDRVRSDRTCARITRPVSRHSSKVITRTVFQMLGPRNATSTMAIGRKGIPKATSARRIKIVSTHPL